MEAHNAMVSAVMGAQCLHSILSASYRPKDTDHLAWKEYMHGVMSNDGFLGIAYITGLIDEHSGCLRTSESRVTLF